MITSLLNSLQLKEFDRERAHRAETLAEQIDDGKFMKGIINVVIAVLFVPGDIDSVCTPDTMNGYWSIAGRCISINDTLYLSTVTRAGGLLLGAAPRSCSSDP
jgi:hypothetical protein